jgi:hypothetical protein
VTPSEPRRYRRKGFRQARRGIPTGRRVTHEVVTTYGRRQKAAAERREMSAAMAGED